MLFFDYVKKVRFYQEVASTIHVFSENTGLMELPMEPDFWHGKICTQHFGAIENRLQ